MWRITVFSPHTQTGRLKSQQFSVAPLSFGHTGGGLSLSGSEFPRHMGHPHRHVVRVLSLSCNCFQHLLQDESLAQNLAVNLSQGHREHKSLLIGEVGINVNLLFLFFCKRKKKSLQKQPRSVCYQQGIYLLPIYYRTQSIIQLPKGLNSIRM